jgi:predicted acylesterase/phospholipase RssA
VQEISSCFGGGGYFAIAFNMGVAEGLEDAGIPISANPMLGTSGGAWAAGALVASVPLQHIVDLTSRGKSSGMSHGEMTSSVFGDCRDERVRTVAIDRRTGRRRILRSDHVGVAHAVGASSAAPGMFPAYPIDGRNYVDGGTYSPTSAHMSAPAKTLVVVAPLAGPLFGRMTAGFSWLARNETTVWRMRHRGRVLLIEPTAAVVDAAGSGWRRLIDATTTDSVYRHARELGRERGLRFVEQSTPRGRRRTADEREPAAAAA